MVFTVCMISLLWRFHFIPQSFSTIIFEESYSKDQSLMILNHFHSRERKCHFEKILPQSAAGQPELSDENTGISARGCDLGNPALIFSWF